MKRYFLLLLIIPLLAACSKLEDNGDLAGAWQLLAWQKQADGQTVADKTSRIYYYFSRELCRIQNLDEALYYLATFHRSADSLYLDDIHVTPYDSIVAPTVLAPYGVNSTGRFRIVRLTANDLVLSNEDNLLTFRKY